MRANSPGASDYEERFRLFAECVTEYAMIILAPDRTILEWNAGATALLGFSAEEAVGQSGDIFFTDADRAAGVPQQEVEQALHTGRAADERWHVRKDGSCFFGRGIMQPLRSADGKILGLAKIFRDETDRQRAEEALTRSNSDLQQFAYVTSHDLQEPLRTVTSFAQLLRQRYHGQLDNQADEYIDYITGAAQRMTNLIRDLLAYSRVISSEELPVSRVPLNAAVDWSIMNLSQSLRECGGNIHRDELPDYEGYEQHFVQLFQNLLGNALKFRGPEAPSVRVTCEKRVTEYLISVSDNGEGIAPEHHERIFGVFKRLHGRDVPGTGMGLAICRRVVERYGGRIWVESEPGRGSNFRFTLPVQ